LLHEKNIPFTIAANNDEAIRESIDNIDDDAWRQFKTKEDIATQKQIASTVHLMQTSPYPLRMVVLKWMKKDTVAYHPILTNISETIATDSELVWTYDQRATQENSIKEVKNGFGMHRMPSGNFKANALFFGIGILAYNLFIAQKHLVLKRHLRTKTIKTIRWLFIQISAKIIQLKQYISVEININTEKFKTILAIMHATDQLSFY